MADGESRAARDADAPVGSQGGTGCRSVGAGDEDRGRARRPRRASLPAPEGSDPEPYDPPTERRPERENDERLNADRPPHWG